VWTGDRQAPAPVISFIDRYCWRRATARRMATMLPVRAAVDGETSAMPSQLVLHAQARRATVIRPSPEREVRACLCCCPSLYCEMARLVKCGSAKEGEEAQDGLKEDERRGS